MTETERAEIAVSPLEKPLDGLLLFTRFPQPGKTKTRLIPALGEVGAADFQRQMTEYLFDRFHRICAARNVRLQVHFAGGSEQQMRDWLGVYTFLMPQCPGNLGDRLMCSLQQGFASGLQRILVVGSDCPHIDESHITQALSLLKTHDVVLGPATDGGYYLIGLKQLWPALFEAVPWSTDRLLTVTQAIAAASGLSVALLDWLSDIDRPEDLSHWRRPNGRTTKRPSEGKPLQV